MNNKSIKSIFFLILFFATLALCQNTAHAVTISASPSPAAVNKAVTFAIDVGDNGCNVSIDYGEGAGYQVLAAPAAGSVLTATHVYTRPGLYTIRVFATICNAPSAPNPGILSLRVSDFNIKRIELKFKNNRSEITINKNERTPGLFTKIKFSGSGFLKGYWEVDGFKRHYVFKHLSTGPTVIIKYPEAPSLPTFTPGTHKVRFVITHPSLNISFPQAIYFVTTQEYIVKVPIKLIFPEKEVNLAYKPVLFQWQPVNKAPLYLLTLFSKEKKAKVFSAYTRQGQYELGPKVLKSRLMPETSYMWQVTGFNDQDQIMAQSKERVFSFNKANAWVPGHILFVTKPTKQGERAILSIKNKFKLQTLEQYTIRSLKLKMTLFFTKEDIFKIIVTAKSQKGILSAQPNFIFRTISEPLSDLQDLSKLLNIKAFDTDLDGRGVLVGIIDTGVDLDHKDLKKAVAHASNFISGNAYKAEIHGTAVAGLIAARENNFGISGLAPGTTLLALRACRQVSEDRPQGECYSSAMIKALDAGIRKNVKIINMSLGAMVKDKLMAKLISYGSDRGILFVAPAGNRKEKKNLNFPASHPKVIAVAGTMEDGSFFPNDEIAKKANFCAPCRNLFTTIPGNDHNFINGTSMSAAVVSGLLALSCEKDPSFDLKKLKAFGGDLQTWIKHILKSEKKVGKKKK